METSEGWSPHIVPFSRDKLITVILEDGSSFKARHCRHFLNETKYLSVACAWNEVAIASFVVDCGVIWLRHKFTAVYTSTHEGLHLYCVRNGALRDASWPDKVENYARI